MQATINQLEAKLHQYWKTFKTCFFLIFEICSLITFWAGLFRQQLNAADLCNAYNQQKATMTCQIGRVVQEKSSEALSCPKNKVFTSIFQI